MLELNNDKPIHCIGIGGIGMSAIAEILLSRGYSVTGSDMNENDKVISLRKKGAVITLEHKKENVGDAQLVIFTAAASSDNPEIICAKEAGIPVLSRAEVLGKLMKEFLNSIAVAGTHGKTSTTSMISLILDNAKTEPTILVGGNLTQINGNVKVGNGDFFITEACEYMDSFLSLRPKIEIILNIDSDHLDYFKDIEHIVESFDRFVSLLPSDGILFAYEANPFVKRVMDKAPNLITFGVNKECDYYAENITFNHKGMPGFDVFFEGEELCHIQLTVPGEHNILNALASTACCHKLGISVETIVETLETFTGTERRFDVQGTTKTGLLVVDDYAHHPTEIKATLSAVKNIPHKNTWCLFQPHTYTRTLALFSEFPAAFEFADKIILSEIYAAREKNIHGISAKELLLEIKKVHPTKEVLYIEDFEEMANFVYNNGTKGDLILTMGAGDIYKVGTMILEKENK